MKKGLLIFLLLAALLIVARLAYSKYCERKEGGCIETPYEDTYLSDDHMDS